MLLGALGYHADNDTLRQRLEDSEESLKVHIAIAADLASEIEQSKVREQQLAAELQHERQQRQEETRAIAKLEDERAAWHSPVTPSIPTAMSEGLQRAVMHALDGRASRAMARHVLRAWRSHCDKVAMLKHMRGIVGESPPSPQPLTNAAGHARRQLCQVRWRLALHCVLRHHQRHSVISSPALAQTRLPRPESLASSRRATQPRPPETPDTAQPTDVQQVGSDRQGTSPRALAPTPEISSPEISSPALSSTKDRKAVARVSGSTGDGGGASTALLPQRLLSWLNPTEKSPDGSSWPAPSAQAHAVQLQHLSTENNFLRERVAMVEASVQPLLEEVSEKRALLHHAYVLCHRAMRASVDSAASSDEVHRWVRGSMPSSVGRGEVADDTEVADAMEAVLEDTLRLNMQLSRNLDELRTRFAEDDGAKPTGTITVRSSGSEAMLPVTAPARQPSLVPTAAEVQAAGFDSSQAVIS